MKDYFLNLRFLYSRSREVDPKFYRRAAAAQIASILIYAASAVMAVRVPALVVAGVTAKDSLLKIMLPVLLLALLQPGSAYLRSLSSVSLAQMRFAEIFRSSLDMLYFSAEKMQGEYGKNVLKIVSRALYRGNQYGMEQFLRCSLDVLKYFTAAAVMLYMSAGLSPWWMLLLLAAGLIKGIFVLKSYEFLERIDEDISDDFYRNRYFERIALQNEAAKDLRLYRMTDLFRGHEYKMIDEHQALIKPYYRKKRNVQILGLAVTAVRDLISVSFLIHGLKNGMSLPQFVLYLSLLPGVGTVLSDLFESLGDLIGNHKSVTEYRQAQAAPRYYEGDFPEHLPKKAGEIRFENVSYAYGDKEVIKNLNLTIKAGEQLALVGDNGAGKTTLAKLAAGLLTPDSGRILIDGVDISRVNPLERYEYTTMIFQDVFLLATTLAENVAAKNVDQIDSERLAEALLKAGLAETVRGLPKGSATELTTYVEPDGTELSGGQRQRLTLARAIYKGGFLILLDEPTSALDPLAEAALYREYLDFTEDKTSIFISHRLSSTQFCDRIVFLEDGTIREEGTHEELMAKQGLYCDMFKTQAKYYQDKIEDESKGSQETVSAPESSAGESLSSKGAAFENEEEEM